MSRGAPRAAPASHLYEALEHAVPGGAIRFVAHGGSFLVADHLLLIGIPSDGAAEPQRHVGQVASHCHLVAIFHFTQRALAGPHAAQPVAFVHGHGVFAAGAVAGVGLHSAFGSLNPRRRLHIGIDRTADRMAREPRDVIDRIDLHLRDDLVAAGQHQVALGPQVELSARGGIAAHGVGFAYGIIHCETARELPNRVLGIRGLAVVFQREPAAGGHHHRGTLYVHAPQHLVHGVSPQVGHLAAGIIPEPAEVVQGAVPLVWRLGGRTEPHVIVDLGWRILDRSLAESRINVAVGSDPDRMDLPQHAAFNDFLGRRHTLALAPLRAHRYDAVVLARRLDHPLALVDEDGHGLLDVDILTRGAGHDGEHRVPVVRRGHHYALDIFVLVHLPKVAVRFRIGISDVLEAFLDARLIHITEADDIHVVATEVPPALICSRRKLKKGCLNAFLPPVLLRPWPRRNILAD